MLNVVVVVGGFFYRQWMEVADLLAFIMYGGFPAAIRRLTNFMQQFESGITGIERFAEIMEVQSDITVRRTQ